MVKNNLSLFNKQTLAPGVVALLAILMISLLANHSITAQATAERDPCLSRGVRCNHGQPQNQGINDQGLVVCKCPEQIYHVQPLE